MSVSYQLKDYTINWEHTAGIQSGPYGRAYGLAFVGNDATLVIDREGWELFPEMENGKYKVPAMPKQPGRESHELHMKNFLECIRTRKDPECTIENGRLVAVYAHIANIALRTNTVWNGMKRQKILEIMRLQMHCHSFLPQTLGFAENISCVELR